MLEAGRSDFRIDPFIHMPAALPFPIGSRFYDWKYETEPEPEMKGRRIYHARGKVLGGSSSINGMIFQRGNPMDYERWAGDKGLEDWDYLHCLPYFKRMETLLVDGRRQADTWRGGSGPLVLERGPATNPLFGAFFEAAQQAGYPLTDDVNGYRQEGFARFDRNVHDGRRLSAARAYLHPVMDRPNLRVETLAMATKVNFDGKRATGVDYLRGGRAHRSVKAGEVILCGGAINTPQLMQLSGIGNPEHLQPLGVPMVHELHGVGENLQDHLEVYIQYASKLPVSIAPGLAWHRRPGIGYQLAVPPQRPRRHQPLRGRRLRAQQRRRRLAEPDVPLPARSPSGTTASSPTEGHGYQVHIGPMYADTRGWVRIASTDPKQHPKMLFNYLSTPNDRREWVEAVRVARDILNQPAFAPFNARRALPGPDGRDRRGDPRLGPRGRRDRAAPLVHGEDGRSTTCR